MNPDYLGDLGCGIPFHLSYMLGGASMFVKQNRTGSPTFLQGFSPSPTSPKRYPPEIGALKPPVRASRLFWAAKNEVPVPLAPLAAPAHARTRKVPRLGD